MYTYRIVREKDMTVKEEEIVKITSPEAIHSTYRDYFESLDREHFEVLHLDTKNHIVGKELISIGSLNSSIVHPRECFKGAIMNSSASIILMHNHPSGETSPSREDISMTKRLTEAGELLGITVLDHIIFGEGKYLSFKEEGIGR